MSCQDTKNPLHAYLDTELDSVRSLEFEEHLKGCPACSRAHQDYQSLRRAMASQSLHFKVPRRVERKVRSAVRKAAANETSRPAWRWSWNWKLQAWFAPFAAAALVTVVTFHFWTQHWTEDQRVQEIVSAHVRSLMVDHLTDVASSFQHIVKPWFTGKLNFSPPVTDPASQGFPLLGARLDYIGGQQVAALVYQRRLHIINLFIWPEKSGSSGELRTPQGYNVIHSNHEGMTYWAISDVNSGDLQEFLKLVQGDPHYK